MTRLKDSYDPRLVLLDLDAAGWPEVLEHGAACFAASREGLAAADLLRRLRKREETGSTALGLGIALPHARVPEIGGALVGVARLARPVEWRAPDGQPVWLAVFIVVDEKLPQLHLQTVARLSRVLHDPARREALRAAPTPAALVEVLAAASA